MIKTFKLISTSQQEFEIPAGKNYAIYNISLSNVSNATSPVNFWIVPNGELIDLDRKFLNAKSLDAGLIYNFNEKLFLSEGDKLVFALDSGTDQINVFISYIEI